MNKERKGFIPVMLTPFEDDGSVDYRTLARLTEYYLRAGARGLFTNCLSGEMYELDEGERMKVLKQVLDVAGGEVPVVATGTFGGAPDRQAGFIRRVHDAGAAAVIVITSIMVAEAEPDAVLEARVSDLLERTAGVPLGFYECPVPYKRVLSAELLKLFTETGRVIYHKDTCLDIDQVKQKLNAAAGSGLGLYDAYAVHAVESLKAGAAGLSCIQGNYFPELIVWLCNNYNTDGLREEVGKVQEFLIRNMEVMHAVYPAAAKYFLQKRGLLKNTVTRKKAETFDDAAKRNIDQLSERYAKLAAEIGVPLP